jgi:macrodomain Ter protein organizer (MatP/YcbG family)
MHRTIYVADVIWADAKVQAKRLGLSLSDYIEKLLMEAEKDNELLRIDLAALVRRHSI